MSKTYTQTYPSIRASIYPSIHPSIVTYILRCIRTYISPSTRPSIHPYMLVCVHGIYYVCAYVSWTLASPNILPCVVSIVSWPDRVLWRVRSGWGDAAVLREKKHPAALPWRACWAKIFRFASQAPNSNDVPKVSTIPTVIQLDRSPPTTPKCRAVASLSGSCTQRILHSCLVWIVHSADSPQYSFFYHCLSLLFIFSEHQDIMTLCIVFYAGAWLAKSDCSSQ